VLALVKTLRCARPCPKADRAPESGLDKGCARCPNCLPWTAEREETIGSVFIDNDISCGNECVIEASEVESVRRASLNRWAPEALRLVRLTARLRMVVPQFQSDAWRPTLRLQQPNESDYIMHRAPGSEFIKSANRSVAEGRNPLMMHAQQKSDRWFDCHDEGDRK
jgi:hypothetical protein